MENDGRNGHRSGDCVEMKKQPNAITAEPSVFLDSLRESFGHELIGCDFNLHIISNDNFSQNACVCIISEHSKICKGKRFFTNKMNLFLMRCRNSSSEEHIFL